MERTAKKSTFVVQVLDTQHQTWQGTVTWLDGKHSEQFRSLLELIRLMDSAIGSAAEPEQGQPDKHLAD